MASFKHPIMGGGGKKFCPTYQWAATLIRDRCMAYPEDWGKTLGSGLVVGDLKYRLQRSGSRYGIGVADLAGRDFMILRPFVHKGERYTVHEIQLSKSRLLEQHWRHIPFNVNRERSIRSNADRFAIRKHTASMTDGQGKQSSIHLTFAFPERAARGLHKSNAGKIGYVTSQCGGPWGDDYLHPIYALRDSDRSAVAFNAVPYPGIAMSAHRELGIVPFSVMPAAWIKSIDSSQQRLAAGVYRRCLELAGGRGKVALIPRRFGMAADVHVEFSNKILAKGDWAVAYYTVGDGPTTWSVTQSQNENNRVLNYTYVGNKAHEAKLVNCPDDAVAGVIEHELMSQLPLA